MVSVQQSQYITDFNSPMSTSMDKSPLAMLEKTCEKIGMPDTTTIKTSPKSKDLSPVNGKKKENDKSSPPRLNPIPALDKKPFAQCEPSTSMAPGMMASFGMPFPYSNGAVMSNPMMPNFPMGYNPLMNPYLAFMQSGVMPPPMCIHTPNGATTFNPACALCACQRGTMNFGGPNIFGAMGGLNGSLSNHICNYTGVNGPCGKMFNSEAEHLAHLRSHVESGENKPKPVSPGNKKPAASPKTAANGRHHPYRKTSAASTPAPQSMVQMPPNGLPTTAAGPPGMNPAVTQMLVNMAMMQQQQQQQQPNFSMGGGMPPFPQVPGVPFSPAAFQAMFAAHQRSGMP